MRNDDLTREMIHAEARENFKHVWVDSKDIAEMSDRLGRTAKSIRATFHALRKIGVILPERPNGDDVHPRNAVYNPSEEEIARQCKKFREAASPASLMSSLRCDYRPSPVEIQQIDTGVRGWND